MSYAEPGTGRPHPLRRRRGTSRPLPDQPARQQSPAAQPPPGRLRRQPPPERAGHDGHPCRPLPAAGARPVSPGPNITGHSSSGSMTLQLALDAPGPCTPSPSWKPRLPPTDTQQRFGKDVTQAAAQRHRTGHPAGAVDPFLPRASSDPATAPHSVTVRRRLRAGGRRRRGCSLPATRYRSSLTGRLAQRQNDRSAQRSRSRRMSRQPRIAADMRDGR